MKYIVTPYTLTRQALTSDPMIALARGNRHTVQPMDGYEERKSIETINDTPEDACEALWLAYQNISELRRTPDRGRSMMTGDMAKLVDEAGNESWWIVCSFGWAKTVKPGAERVEVNR